MKIDMTDLLNSITENLKRIDYIKPEEIPNIDLYMDQVRLSYEKNPLRGSGQGFAHSPNACESVRHHR